MGSVLGLLDELKVMECDVPKEVNGDINHDYAQGTHFTIQQKRENVEAK